jgi:hypothetical protein
MIESSGDGSGGGFSEGSGLSDEIDIDLTQCFGRTNATCDDACFGDQVCVNYFDAEVAGDVYEAVYSDHFSACRCPLGQDILNENCGEIEERTIVLASFAVPMTDSYIEAYDNSSSPEYIAQCDKFEFYSASHEFTASELGGFFDGQRCYLSRYKQDDLRRKRSAEFRTEFSIDFVQVNMELDFSFLGRQSSSRKDNIGESITSRTSSLLEGEIAGGYLSAVSVPIEVATAFSSEKIINPTTTTTTTTTTTSTTTTSTTSTSTTSTTPFVCSENQYVSSDQISCIDFDSCENLNCGVSCSCLLSLQNSESTVDKNLCKCDDIDYCASTSCSESQECSQIFTYAGSYATCDCIDGTSQELEITADSVELLCINIDECELGSHTCPSNAICIDQNPATDGIKYGCQCDATSSYDEMSNSCLKNSCENLNCEDACACSYDYSAVDYENCMCHSNDYCLDYGNGSGDGSGGSSGDWSVEGSGITDVSGCIPNSCSNVFIADTFSTTQFSSRCACMEGTTEMLLFLNGFEFICENINECESSSSCPVNSACIDGNPIDEESMYECICDGGFLYDADANTCQIPVYDDLIDQGFSDVEIICLGTVEEGSGYGSGEGSGYGSGEGSGEDPEVEINLTQCFARINAVCDLDCPDDAVCVNYFTGEIEDALTRNHESVCRCPLGQGTIGESCGLVEEMTIIESAFSVPLDEEYDEAYDSPESPESIAKCKEMRESMLDGFEKTASENGGSVDSIGCELTRYTPTEDSDKRMSGRFFFGLQVNINANFGFPGRKSPNEQNNLGSNVNIGVSTTINIGISSGGINSAATDINISITISININVNPTTTTTTTSTTTTTTTSTTDPCIGFCCGKDFGSFHSHEDCDKFYRCVHTTTPVVFDCAPGTYWDQVSLGCLRPALVDTSNCNEPTTTTTTTTPEPTTTEIPTTSEVVTSTTDLFTSTSVLTSTTSTEFMTTSTTSTTVITTTTEADVPCPSDCWIMTADGCRPRDGTASVMCSTSDMTAVINQDRVFNIKHLRAKRCF